MSITFISKAAKLKGQKTHDDEKRTEKGIGLVVEIWSVPARIAEFYM